MPTFAYCNAPAAGVDSVTTTAAGAALKANNFSDLCQRINGADKPRPRHDGDRHGHRLSDQSRNLAGLADLPTARTNLGLGTAAVANTGTGASNVILGNDSRLTDTRTPSAASIVDAMIANTLSPSKITGTAAILGANTFTAQQFIDGSARIRSSCGYRATRRRLPISPSKQRRTKFGGWDRYDRRLHH